MSNKKFVGLTGGYRSGKTVAGCVRKIRLAKINWGYDTMMIAPIHRMVKRNLIPTMTWVLRKLEIPFTPKTSDMKFILHDDNLGDTNLYYDSIESIERVAGMTLADFGGDEMDLAPMERAFYAHRLLVSRLTTGNYLSGFYDSTPEGFNFLHKFFVEDAMNEDGSRKDDRELFVAPTWGNPFFDVDTYIATMRTQYDAHLLEAYLEGKFVNLTTGSVYRDFVRAECNSAWHVTSPVPGYKYVIPQESPLIIGMDFNKGIMANCTMWLDEKTNDLHILEDNMGLPDTQAVVHYLKAKYPRRRLIIYPDSTGDTTRTNSNVSDIAILKNNFGLDNVKAFKNNMLVNDRVNAVNGRIKDGYGRRHLYVNVQKAPNVAKSMEQQILDKGKPDKKAGLDHMADAFGYPICRLFPIKSHYANVARVSGG